MTEGAKVAESQKKVWKYNILELDQENQRKFDRLERMLDPRGWTFRNPILIDLDPEDWEVDVVTLVDHE